MSDEQIDQMRGALVAGVRLAWRHDGRHEEISQVTEIDGEPAGVLLSGGYIALWATLPEDIVAFTERPFFPEE